MYDYDKIYHAAKKFILDFDVDMYLNPFAYLGTGRILEMLDLKQVRWPGYNLPSDASFQFVEEEYMTPQEYDDFLSDPSGFMIQVYYPRVCGAMEPFKLMPDLPVNYYFRIPRGIAALGNPEVAAAIDNLLKAGKEAQIFISKSIEFAVEMETLGYPAMVGGVAPAPFDYWGDMFRGTRGIMLDLFRVPDKLFEAIEKVIPMLARSAILTAKQTGVPHIFMPLHKGLDGFMSLEHFYARRWKKILLLLGGK